jgi:hypothetical protein
MVTERFTVVALPHSVAAGADFHVSLFVSPQLVPDGDGARLRRFRHFPHWADVLASAAIELTDQDGPIPVQPLLGPLKPGFWDAVFPPETPVRVTGKVEFDDRRWRTFRAGEIHDDAKVLHLAAMYTDPVSPPLPTAHPLARLLGGLDVGGRLVGAFNAESPNRRDYDESLVTAMLDRAIGEGEDPADAIPLERLERQIDAMDDPGQAFARLALQVHRARRFYERPEAQHTYRDRPRQNPTHKRPPRPKPEFHERCSLVADHPALQRRLGLVVDLVADDPDRLRGSEWLSGRIVPQGDQIASVGTRTRCRVAGDDLVTVPASEDWVEERLRLGDTELFALLDMDPDGTALKVDRFLWTIPRLLAIEANDDPVHAAPTALRSIGFTVVRNRKALLTKGRIENQGTLKDEVAGGAEPFLNTEDVTQGMRVEVFDDTARAWFTLHARRIDARPTGRQRAVRDLPEEGFIQGTAPTETPDVEKGPVHVHESVFGWEGWSLSAARPGKRVRHEAGDELPEPQDADPDPVTPLEVTVRVEPGSLPRLRYGRSYAFRAWAVNLAGNSRAHATGPSPAPPAPVLEAVSIALGGTAPPTPGALLTPTLRSETAAGVLRRRMVAVREPEAAAAAELAMLPDVHIEAEVLSRLRARRAETVNRARVSPVVTSDRAARVTRAFGDAVVDEAHPFIVDTALRDPGSVAAAAFPAGPDVAAVPRVLDVITPLRPFLRWDPVPPPVVVARHRFSSGESLRQLVVRSGVTQDLDTLAITVRPPGPYAAAHAVLAYRASSERHLAPPKTSQSEAELHGAFDTAIGSIDPSDQAAMLAVALREAGTLFDRSVPRLDDPRQSDLQHGVRLESEPNIQAPEIKKLPLDPGEAPAAGQYIVHDTDTLVLPYLPDVAARGISLVFPEAGRDRTIAFPFGTEGFTAAFRGRWPERQPFRLVLDGSDVLSGDLNGTVLRIGLPPGDVQRFRLASSLRREDLDLFGLWRSLPPVIHDDPDVAEAAADGWLWALTPFEEVTLLHAVPRPLEMPRPTTMLALRLQEGTTDVHLAGAVDVHGPSTEMITAEARWRDRVDDINLPGPDRRRTKAIALTSPIRETEDLAILWGETDAQVVVPGAGPVWLHGAVHRLGDTRHHMIHYRFRAATRFREYFDPETLAAPTPAQPPGPGEPVDDGQSVVGPEITLDVPSSARPAAPIVYSVLPLFRWETGTEPEQPVATRHRRRTGVRIYLERPWFSSGNGELLGVLLAPAGDDSSAVRHPVSQWGADPVWMSAPVQRRAMFLELDNFLRAAGLDDRPGDALPVAPPATLPLGTIPGRPLVTVLGYRPRYNPERQLWYVDVAIDPGSTFWPFVRLAVARYQRSSIEGCHLSAPVRCDFVQLPPERTTSVSRTDVRHVRVVVSGPIGVRERPAGAGTSIVGHAPGIDDYAAWIRMHRVVVARLQRVDPTIRTDLGWETVATTELAVEGFGRNLFEAAWVGQLETPTNVRLRTPGANRNWRVTVEEWERLPGDPADLADPSSPPVWEQRLIYADEIAL